jgi:hypothetical protein
VIYLRLLLLERKLKGNPFALSCVFLFKLLLLVLKRGDWLQTLFHNRVLETSSSLAWVKSVRLTISTIVLWWCLPLFLRIYPFNGVEVGEKFWWDERVNLQYLTINLDNSWRDIYGKLFGILA